MGIVQTAYNHHWEYFLALEDDLARIGRFVQFSTDNYGTYSIELARLLLASCAEVDAVLRELCSKIAPGQTYDKMPSRFSPISNKLKMFIKFEARIPRFGLTLHPFEDWTANNSPAWWTAYNKIKHRGEDGFESATLKHTLNSITALFIATIYLNRNDENSCFLEPRPQLLRTPDMLGIGRILASEQGLDHSPYVNLV